MLVRFAVVGFALAMALGCSSSPARAALGWTPPVQVAAGGLAPGARFDAAADGAGVSTFIWPTAAGGGRVVQMRRLLADGSLAATQQLSNVIPGNAFFSPKVAVEPGGAGVVAWGLEENNGIGGRTFGPDGALGPISEFLPPEGGEIGNGAGAFEGLGIDPGRTITAMWLNAGQTQSSWQFGQVSAIGVPSEIRNIQGPMSTEGICSSGHNSVLPVSSGDVFFLWEWSSNVEEKCFAHISFRQLHPNGTLGETQELLPEGSKGDGADSTPYGVAAEPDGGAIVVFIRSLAKGTERTGWEADAERISPSGVVGPPQALASAGIDLDPLESYAPMMIDPDVAVGPSGEAVAAWSRNPGTSYYGNTWVLEARRIDPGGALGATVPLRGPGPGAGAHIGVDSGGVATAVWGEGGEGGTTSAVRFDVAGNRSAAVLGPGDGGEPRIVVPGNGIATASWLDGGSLMASRFTDVPGPEPPKEPPPGAVAPPRFGQLVTVSVLSGRILVRLPGTHRFKLLGATDSIPVGSIVDATRGHVALTSAKGPAGGQTQTAELYGGVFQIKQPGKGKPTTELDLIGFVPSECPRTGVSAGASRARPGRSGLWTSGHGNYTTRGHYASAAVRGTIWLTEDTCAGTLVKSKRDSVVVTDFARHRKVVLHTGQSYLARR